MIVVPVKEGENIEKALKKFKRKFEKNRCCKGIES
jgi:small subunit ribosomal protein S21